MHAAAAFFKRECGANGKEPQNQKPANDTAARALAKIVKPFIPIAVKRLEREIDDFDATRQAERMIAEAKAAADGAKQPTQAKDTKASTDDGKQSRPTNRQVLAHIKKTQG